MSNKPYNRERIKIMSLFEASVRAAAKKVLDDVNLKSYQISWELFSLVVSKTPSPSNPGPTAKGLLANQWYPQTGSASGNKGTATNPAGGDSLSRIRSMMSGKEFHSRDGKFTLTNNMDYAEQAESKGWAKTPPYRMVALSLQATVIKFKQVKI